MGFAGGCRVGGVAAGCAAQADAGGVAPSVAGRPGRDECPRCGDTAGAEYAGDPAGGVVPRLVVASGATAGRVPGAHGCARGGRSDEWGRRRHHRRTVAAARGCARWTQRRVGAPATPPADRRSGTRLHAGARGGTASRAPRRTRGRQADAPARRAARRGRYGRPRAPPIGHGAVAAAHGCTRVRAEERQAGRRGGPAAGRPASRRGALHAGDGTAGPERRRSGTGPSRLHGEGWARPSTEVPSATRAGRRRPRTAGGAGLGR